MMSPSISRKKPRRQAKLLLKECGCPLSQPGSCRFQSLILIFFCLQGFDGIIAGTCSNNWAEYLVQLFGPNGAVAILSLLWVDSTCATASCFMSAQRVCLSSESFYPDFNVSRTMEHNSFPQLQCLEQWDISHFRDRVTSRPQSRWKFEISRSPTQSL